MNLLNQIVPRLSRSLARQPEASRSAGAGDPEFTVKPAYEVTESPEAWGLTAHLPGVAKEALELTAEEGRITLRGRPRRPLEKETAGACRQAPGGVARLCRAVTPATYP